MRVSKQFLILTFLFGTIAFVSLPAKAQSSTDAAYFEFSDLQNPKTFIFKLTDPNRIQEARDILSTGNQKIVNGIIIKQPVYYNPNWSFHYDPKTIGFAEATIELCQSTIQGIEDNLDNAWPGWCPSTKLLREVTPTPPGNGNISPTISMTDPYRDFSTSSWAPGIAILKANADDPDGTISKVEFFHDGTKLAEDNSWPYSFTWDNLGSGVYSVSAIATDNQGATRASKSLRFTVVGLEDSYFFVTQHYRDFLNRLPETEGLFFWVANIESCGADLVCRQVRRIDTSAAFFLSIEFQETGYLVHRFYKASYGRRPLFAEFLPDTQAIGNGVIVNKPGWEQLLESNKQSFTNSWVTRPAFTAIYDGLSNAQFVDTLIANTGAIFGQPTRDALVNALNGGSKTRAQVLRDVAENQAFYNAEFNAAFVEMQYFGYLRRNPQDPPDNNLEGFNFWLNKLNSFGGDYRRAELVKAFLESDEYRRRFTNP